MVTGFIGSAILEKEGEIGLEILHEYHFLYSQYDHDPSHRHERNTAYACRD